MHMPGVESELVDLSGVRLDDLPGTQLPPSDASMSRLLGRIDDGEGSYGGYQPPREAQGLLP
ncbi:hypothetical protein [Streptomyces sp. NPDC049099]|uniref:hypothetical protein n=1 Tax=unclassified Streptomyces TaxID=2593676 RepID=UPI0034252672